MSIAMPYVNAISRMPHVLRIVTCILETMAYVAAMARVTTNIKQAMVALIISMVPGHILILPLLLRSRAIPLSLSAQLLLPLLRQLPLALFLHCPKILFILVLGLSCLFLAFLLEVFF